jgi:diacylglycerol kinase (ATP)
MRYRVIVNPLAGRGFGERSIPRIEGLLSEHGLDFDLVCTTEAGEAVGLARQAVLAGYDVVVAAGGDGTYQEVINGMMTVPPSQWEASNGIVGTLGMIPVGSGCDFAWASEIPADLEGACARLARHQTKVVDVGKVWVDVPKKGAAAHAAWQFPEETITPTDQGPSPDKGAMRYFDNTVGIGFDGLVTEEVRKVKFLRGLALYLPVVLKTVFLSYQPARSRIEYELNGSSPAQTQVGQMQKTVLMATICNGGREGGGFYIAPDAKNDDGLLDLCVAENIPRLQILGMVPQFMQGTHVDKPIVTMLRSKRVLITSPDPLIAHADGEMLCTQAHRIECEIVPQALRIVC